VLVRTALPGNYSHQVVGLHWKHVLAHLVRTAIPGHNQPFQGGTRAQSDLNKRHRERRIGWSQESVPKYYANSLQ
ncbi:Hypothetical predicted protein, partial [Cloeon dipterum]